MAGDELSHRVARMHDFTFIVCTRNRGEQLRRTLRSVSKAVQACPEHSFEFILVDNGSNDNTAEVFDAWARSSGLEARRLFVEKPGLSLCRNIGAAAATADTLIFTDDDCALSESYCRELADRLAANSEKRIFGGRVELGNGTDIPFTIKRSMTGERLGPITHPGNIVLGCNMIVPRSVLAELGPFDERFGAGSRYRSGEETDLFYRARRKNVVVEYVPDMVVYHFHGRKTISSIKKLSFDYHFGSGALYAKYFLTDPGFSRHMYWSLKNAVRESFGGPRFEPESNLSHWSMLRGNLAGLATYAGDCLTDFARQLVSRKQPASNLRA